MQGPHCFLTLLGAGHRSTNLLLLTVRTYTLRTEHFERDLQVNYFVARLVERLTSVCDQPARPVQA